MLVTGLGHAGIRIETDLGVVLCDPWSSPAFFGSWYPFPDNSSLDWKRLGQTDYLYISHSHEDHLDCTLLGRYVNKDAQVILPPFPSNALRAALLDIGFRHYIEPVADQTISVGGLAFTLQITANPTDGPMGDSALLLTDGLTTLYNQNDARVPPPAAAHIDAHFLQFSGAIWYPAAYRYGDQERFQRGREKRSRQMVRATRAIEQVGARLVFPFAGPPCFLDAALWDLNDFDDSEDNIFQDQASFIAAMGDRGVVDARLLLPGTEVALDPGSDSKERHAIAPESVFGVSKRAYLEAYRDRVHPAAPTPGPRAPASALSRSLKPYLEAPMRCAPTLCKAVGGMVRVTALPLSTGIDVVLDFLQREVRPYSGEDIIQSFEIPAPLIQTALNCGSTNWTDTIFLSMRFRTRRRAEYNEAIYAYFRCLSPKDARWAECWYAGDAHARGVTGEARTESITLNGQPVSRWCPHLGADLEVYGDLNEDVLTCQMHGWRWRVIQGSAELAPLPPAMPAPKAKRIRGGHGSC